MSASGERIGPFHLEEMIGEGGQGAVWRAKDVRSGRVVALKVMRASLTGPNELARLRRETAILQSMSDPGLPSGVEFIEEPRAGVIGFAMEHVDGAPLARVMSERRLPVSEVIVIGREVARILAVIHGSGIIHRDLKPANIILRTNWLGGGPGSVVLVDFGIARGETQHSTQHTATGTAVGTVAFMSPELLLPPPSGVPASRPSPTLDVYSFGVLLWALLAGRHPTGLGLDATLSELVLAYARPQSPALDSQGTAVIEREAPAFLAMLRRCLEVDPARRIADGAELVRAMEGVTSATSLTVTGPRSSGDVASGAGSWTSAVAPGGYTSVGPAPSWTEYQSVAAERAARQAPTQLVDHRRSSPASPSRMPLLLGVAGTVGLIAVLGTTAGVLVWARPPIVTSAVDGANTAATSPLSAPKLESGSGTTSFDTIQLSAKAFPGIYTRPGSDYQVCLQGGDFGPHCGPASEGATLAVKEQALLSSGSGVTISIRRGATIAFSQGFCWPAKSGIGCAVGAVGRAKQSRPITWPSRTEGPLQIWNSLE